MKLSDKQIDWIAKDLFQRGLTYHPLQEEILDHICCHLEAGGRGEENFEEHYQRLLSDFGEEGFGGIQSEILHLLTHKKRTMRKLTALTFSIFLAVVVFLSFSVFAQNAPSMHPLGKATKVTSPFGPRIHPIQKKQLFHKGMDFKAAMGTPIYATADGEVKATVAKEKGHGKHLILQHDTEYQTMYANLSQFVVVVGTVVKKGQLIAYSGNSGSSTAPHLHYEVWKNGESVDPKDFL